MLPPNLPDDRLVERASEGERRALAAIFKRYHQDLYRYCAAIVGNPEDAKDALQNTMVRVLSALPGERRRLQLKPWLYRIAHNEAIEIVRKRRPAEPIDPEALAGAPGPSSSAEARERLRQLIADLQELPERQRGALVMRELGGLSFEQIGAAFETSPSTARQTIYEARLGLQQMEKGREMRCEEIRRKLSDGDRRVYRRRDVRAHLRQCAGCREFEAAMSSRRRDLAAISPLPALAAIGIFKGVFGGVAGQGIGAAGSGVGSSIGVGSGAIGGTIAGSTAAKTVAVVAVAGAIGVSAADRADLVHVFPGTDRAARPAKAGGESAPVMSPADLERKRFSSEGTKRSSAANADLRARRALRGESVGTADRGLEEKAAPGKPVAEPKTLGTLRGAGAGRGDPSSNGKAKQKQTKTGDKKSPGPSNAQGANPHAHPGRGAATHGGRHLGQGKAHSQAKANGQAKSAPSSSKTESKNPPKQAEAVPGASPPTESGPSPPGDSKPEA